MHLNPFQTVRRAERWTEHQRSLAFEQEQQKILQDMLTYRLPEKPSFITRTYSRPSLDVRESYAFLASRDLTSTANDSFELARALGKRPLSSLASYLIVHEVDTSDFHLDPRKLETFLRLVEDGYRNVPYHNKVHAMDVLQRTHAIATHMDLSSKQSLALYLAAAVHDYAHGGVTNSYLSATRHLLARRYNYRSPWENFHVSQALELYRAPQCNFVSEAAGEEVAHMMIELVLATDMANHVAVMRRPDDTATDSQRKLWEMKVALKCADVGHTALPEALHVRWGEALKEELQHQGVLEREAGLPVSWEAMEDSQHKFFDGIIIPMMEVLSTISSAGSAMLERAKHNRSLYAPTS